MNVKTVGYYKEMPHRIETTDSIYDFINKEKQERIKSICKYLDSGLELIVSPGVTEDIIEPLNGNAGTTSTFTDGIWLWPGDLSYYVRNYRLKLPDDFITTMKNNNWKVNISLDDLNFEEMIVDGIDFSQKL